MIREIINSCKFYYVGGTLRWIILGMGSIFTLLASIVAYKLFKIETDSILSFASIFVIVLTSVSSTTFMLDSKGYSKFIRSIPRAYEKQRNVLILNIFISIFSFLIFYFITGSLLKLFIKNFRFDAYVICYIVFIGLFFSGIAISTINSKVNRFMIFFIGAFSTTYSKFISGLRESEYWYGFVEEGNVKKLQAFEGMVKSPQTIMLLTLTFAVFLIITYKIALAGIRKRW